MTATALRLAAESGTRLVAMYPIEVPLDRPLSDPMEPRRPRPSASCGRPRRWAASTVWSVITRIVRTRNIGEAIVEEAAGAGSEIIVMGAARRASAAASGCSGA